MEEFVREMREMEATADEIYERDSVRFHLQPAPLSRALEKSRAELSRLNAEDESGEDTTAMLVEDLRHKVCRMDEQCDKLDREKAVLADLLNAKKKDFDQMKQHYKKRISELEDETARLKGEKNRLVDKLKLPESERSSLAQQENDLAALKRRLDDAEARCSDLIEENAELKQEVKDVQLEMEEMHDQFREEETMEFRELQKELETTAKSCRILQFKLRKTERRNEQLETERIQTEEKLRQVESRLSTSDDKQHIMELELELTAAKETNAKLRSELEGVEEKKARFEEELDRVNDLLTQSEARRKELEGQGNKGNAKEINGKPASSSLKLPQIGALGKQGSQEIDVAQLMRDLSDSLERENDLKEQLRFSEEETRIVRKKLAELEEENESVNMQLHKISTAKTTLVPSAIKKSPTRSTGKVEELETIIEREHELKLQMELAEQEVKVLRRKLDDREKLYEDLLSEVKVMASRVQGHRGAASSPGDPNRNEEEKLQDLAKDIEVLKWKLTEKDKDPERARASLMGRGIQKSRSLEEPSSPEYQVDYRKQLETVQQEAGILKDKIYSLEKENDKLINENKKLHILSSRVSKSPQPSGPQGDSTPLDLQGRIQQLEADNVSLSESVSRLESRAAELSKELVRARFSAEAVVETSVEWRELRSQVQFLEDENRLQRRKAVDLEAANSKLGAELDRLKGDVRYKDSKAYKELQNETLENLKRRIVEQDNELASMTVVVKNREEDNERLQAELNENRDDMKRMLDSIRRRELELQDELKSIQHKNDMLSDLLDLVTERAESTQKELDRQRKEAVRAASGAEQSIGVTPSPEATPSSVATSPGLNVDQNQRENMKTIESLQRQLEEEKRRVQAAEKRLKMTDVPLSSAKDDTRLREHEKSILLQELALCQKQLKSADDQIHDLKDRMLSMRESHDDIKEDFAKVSKQLEQAREQGVSKAGTSTSGDTTEKGSTTAKSGPSKPERAPASWRWEKQELERQLKEYMKKLDDVHSEMKRSQIKWKAAGEDIERDNKIKEELEKKISKLKEDCETYKKKAEEYEDKLDEIQDQLHKKEKQWEKERHMLCADKVAAETDVKQKDDVIRSKDELIGQKNQLIAEKDTLLADRNDALQQKDIQLQQKESEQEFKDRDLRMKSEEISQYRNELFEFRAHLLEKEERIKQLDEHVRRRDERLNEKDTILQQINRKLVEKGNQISDMDKTIRQVIRKLQARDCDLSMCNAELKRVQSELKNMTERLSDAKKTLEETQNESKKQNSEWRNHVQELEANLEALKKKNERLMRDLKEAEEATKSAESQWKKENDRLQMELNNTQERLHVKEVTETMNQTEAFKLMMKEKETLIGDKFKLSDEVKQLKKEISAANKEWEKEKEELETAIKQKGNELDNIKVEKVSLEAQISRLKDLLSASPAQLPLTSLTLPTTSTTASGIPSGTSPSQAELLAALQSRLAMQETNWRAEKATLEEFYEVNARGLKDRVAALKESCEALRRENDSQLQLLATSRRALSDLRNRYDIGLASWSEDKQRLEASNDLASEFKERVVILEMTVERLKSESRAAESRRQEVENNLMLERNQWSAERSALEEKLKKYTSVEEKGGSTRVSQFRAKFEAFGNTKSKKSIDGAVEKDIQEACRELQQQLSEAEKARQTEREEVAQRAEQLRSAWEKENKQLRDRNNVLERKAGELVQVQRALVDVQCRLVEDRHQWQLDRAELQHQIEEWRKAYLQQKESINKLLADVKKLKVLASGVDLKALGAGSGTTAGDQNSSKTRQRSITSSAEKLRTAAAAGGGATVTIHTGSSSSSRSSGTAQQLVGAETAANAISDNSASTNTDETGVTSRCVTPAVFSLVQAIEMTSRLADDISQSRIDQKILSRSQASSASFKRSKSTVEVESESRRSQLTQSTLPPTSASSQLYTQTVPSNGSASYSSNGNGGVALRRPPLEFSRSSSQEDDPYSDLRSSLRKPPSNRGSMYASGTQSAYGSRDASPDKAPSISMRRVSPYPLAPPSMIITPSHTPKREESVERSHQDSSFTPEDIRRIYEQLDAIGQDSAGEGLDRGRTARGVPSGRIMGVKSTSVDVNTDASGAMQLATGYQQINIPSSGETKGAKPASLVDTLVSQSRSRLAVDSSMGGGTAGKRANSVSPRTARKQFYSEYDSKIGSHRAPVFRSDLPNVLPEGIAEGFVASPFSPSRSYEASSSTGSLSATGDQAQAASSEERPSAKSKFSAASFFQTVKEKRKLFGTKKSRSVDSSVTGVSIGKIGANVLTEPAAPSTYQPPAINIPERGAKSGGKVKHKRTTSIDSSAVHSTGQSTDKPADKSKKGTT